MPQTASGIEPNSDGTYTLEREEVDNCIAAFEENEELWQDLDICMAENAALNEENQALFDEKEIYRKLFIGSAVAAIIELLVLIVAF